MSSWIAALFIVWNSFAQAKTPTPDNSILPRKNTSDAASPEAIESWLDSVVLLLTGTAWCSGAVIDDQGTVLTAYHCIANGRRPQVTTRAGEEYIAPSSYLVTTAPKDDLAIISIPELAGTVPPLALREDVPLRGTRVYGLGHPYAPVANRTAAMEGMLLWSVTEGIISAVGPRLLQTDAALNPGNSGGPVVDREGRIVGITSRKVGQADNVAFLASGQLVEPMLEDPKKPSVFRGQLELGFGFLGGVDSSAAQTMEFVGNAVIQDRALLTLGFTTPTLRTFAIERGTIWTPSYEATGALRHRFGRGNWSTSIDIGGGLYGITGLSASYDTELDGWTYSQIGPASALGYFWRISLAGVGLRWITMGCPLEPDQAKTTPPWSNSTMPAVMIGLDIQYPGPLVTF